MGNGITNCYPDEVGKFISITVLTEAALRWNDGSWSHGGRLLRESNNGACVDFGADVGREPVGGGRNSRLLPVVVLRASSREQPARITWAGASPIWSTPSRTCRPAAWACGWVLAGQGPQIGTTPAAGRLLFGTFAALAEFERELTREPHRARLTAARAAFRCLGALRSGICRACRTTGRPGPQLCR